MDEEKIVIPVSEVELTSNAELHKQETVVVETAEQIDINPIEELVIDVSEATGVIVGDSIIPSHTHVIDDIPNLLNKLNQLGSAESTIYSQYGGYAEFRTWKPLAQNAEVGRFVGLVYQNKSDPITGGNTFIEVCDGNTDVYGVTVGESAFCGYQDPAYCLLEPTDNSTSNCAKVCLLGVVSVRQGADYDNATVGDYVVSDSYGCAVRSENGVGFRVVGVGQYSGASDSYWNYKYVDIALVPQNDNVARVMAELEGARQNLGNLSIQIGDLTNKTNNLITSVSSKVNQALADANGAISDTQTQLSGVKDALDKAQNISSEAKQVIEKVKEEYKKAVTDATTAKETAEKALEDVGEIEDNMTVLSQHKDKIAGFFDDASEEEVTLATLVKQAGDMALIKQKVDENGATIQHLVAHADKYSVGKHSPTYGLTYEQALGILGQTGLQEANGYIYVAIETHTEEDTIYDWLDSKVITFEDGKVYVWRRDSNGSSDTAHRWQESTLAVAIGVRPTKPSDGDLWYTPNGEVENSVWIYEPQTLYRWTAYDETDGDWIAVARANDGNARTMSFINQTAKEISSTVTNLEGNVSEISQMVDTISSTILGDDGIISRINQTAEAITLGAHSPNKGMSSLEVLLNGMRSTAGYGEHVLVGVFGGSVASGITKYETPPTWGDDGFSFAVGTELIEEKYPMYYFDSDKRTYYRKQIDDNTYEIYTIGNQAMANISTRVDDNESAIESWTKFESETKQALTSITQTSDKDAAEIVSMVLGQYKHLAEIKDNITEAEKQVIGNRYNEAPIWNEKFVFVEGLTPTNDGLYCIPTDSGGKYYWKLLLDSNDSIVGYEKYEMKKSNYASLMQKTNEDGSEISLVAGNNNVEGGVFVEAINGQSKVLIEANKIGISGTAVFSDSLVDGKTTISGNHIKTGVITSNNYSGPVTYRMYGAAIGIDEDGNKIITTDELSKCIYYTPIVDGKLSTTDYYYANIIKAGEKLFTEPQENSSQYIVSAKNFDLVPSNIKIEGTKFDLNEGTIYSKNLSLNRDGDLTITGRITATSGYIGDGMNGFTIDAHNSIRTYTVSSDGLKAGKYYFKHNDKYYLFEVDEDLSVDEQITLDCDTSEINLGGTLKVITPTNQYPIDAEYLVSELTTGKYYLENGQESLTGSQDIGTDGVYISPDGIGLGNGNFYVDKSGNLITNGGITLNSISEDNTTISQITLKDGEMSLISETKTDEETKTSKILLSDGNIKLTGSIAWDIGNSLICVLYANDDYNRPTYDDYVNANENSTNWHTIYQTDDLYVSYSYDGGEEWTWPIRMRGEDGESVDVEAILEDVYGITYTHITGTSIESPSISSPNITAGTINSVTMNSSKISGGIIDGANFNGGNFYGGNYYTKGLQDQGGSAYYLFDEITFANDTFSFGNQVGYLGYDGRGAGSTAEAKKRVYFGTSNGTALKIQSDANMSLQAKGTIYFMSNVEFAGSVTIPNLKVTFG